MKNKYFFLCASLIAVILVLGFVIIKLINQSHMLRSYIPHLLVGDKIEYFELVGMTGEPVDLELLNPDQPTLIFIFSRPCTTCDKNIEYWKKIARMVEGRADVFGIILAAPEVAIDFAEKAKLRFEVYVPNNIDSFIEHFHARLNISQTILYQGMVRQLYIGELTGELAGRLIDSIRFQDNNNGK